MARSFGIAVLAVIGLIIVMGVGGMMIPAPKCGEVGYRAKLTPACRAALPHPDSEQYCSADEIRDLKCAQATRDQQTREDMDRIAREMNRRT